MAEYQFPSLTKLSESVPQESVDAIARRCDEVAEYLLTLKPATADLVRRVEELLRLSGICARRILTLSDAQFEALSLAERRRLKRTMSNCPTVFYNLMGRDVPELRSGREADRALCHDADRTLTRFVFLELMPCYISRKFPRRFYEAAEVGFKSMLLRELIAIATGCSASPYREWVELSNSGLHPLGLCGDEFVLHSG